MKNIAAWNFNAPVDKVDIRRILDEAQDAVGLATAVLVTVVMDGVRYYTVLVGRDTAFKRGLGQPNGYLGVETSVERDSFDGQLAIDAAIPGEVPLFCAPAGAVAIYLFTSHNQARAFVARALDLVEVKVEIF